MNIIGRENLPSGGPAILVANHPSAFLDPLLITIALKSPIYYLAAAEFFKKGFLNWIFRNGFNMIPVFRPEKFENADNESMFEACFENLQKGRIILIFAEGTSVTEYRLRKLKTGAVRIKAGAEKNIEDLPDVPIIPIGMNYTNPHQFQSSVTIKIGAEVKFTSEIDPNNRESVDEATTEVFEALKNQIWHINRVERDAVAIKVLKVLRHSLISDMETDGDRAEAIFTVQKEILNGVNYFDQHEPERIQEAEVLLDNYFEKLRKAKIKDENLIGLEVSVSMREYLRIFLGALLAIPSLLINSVPFLISRYLFRNFVLPKLDFSIIGERNVPAFAGSMAFAIGFIFYTVWYILLSIVAYNLLQIGWWSFFLFLVLYLAGLYSLSWTRAVTRWNRKRVLRKLIDNNRELFSELIIDREKIMKIFKSSTEEYLSSRPDPI